MFESKTLFVVGAGASAEIDLPVGSTLLETIAEKLNISFQHGHHQISGDYDIVEAIRLYARERNENQNLYFQKSRMIEQAVPVAPSIDNFMDAHKKDEHLQFCGKLGIVASILEAERNSRLFVDESNGGRDNLNRLNGTWYTAFMKMLVERVDLDAVDSVFDNVSFITFNYDRCIQKFMHVALQKYYAIDPGRAANLVSKLKIIHPYGSIGRLPFEDSGRSVVAYGGSPGVSALIDAANRIRTFTEQIEDEDSLSAIRECVNHAETVVFMGFAFHPQNMQLLDVSPGSDVKRVFATSYGCSRADVDVITSRIASTLGYDASGNEFDIDIKIPHDLKCSGLLSEFSRSIPAAIS